MEVILPKVIYFHVQYKSHNIQILNNKGLINKLLIGQKKFIYNTPFVSNYLSVLIGTQILKNLRWICENTQLGSNPGLNRLPMSYFTPKTELSIKRYDGLIMLEFSFHDQFSKFCIKMCYNLCHVCRNCLKFGVCDNW
jgi:hypothetical protein